MPLGPIFLGSLDHPLPKMTRNSIVIFKLFIKRLFAEFRDLLVT